MNCVRSFKQTVENNIIVFLFAALVTGFGTGWGAYIAIQRASDLTPISSEHLKQLEKLAAENNDPREKVQQLESERADLQSQLLKNRPVGGNYVANISLSPVSPAVLKAHDPVIVKFDYVFARGTKGYIYAQVDDGSVSSQFEGSALREGAGSDSRYVLLMSSGRITAIEIRMVAEDGEDLYSMTLPVKYTYK
jgi:hypothetical protein